MKTKHSKLNRSKVGRSLAVSLAGLRAGGALALDGALQKLRPDEYSSEKPFNSPFARREARRFVTELGRLKGTYVKIGQMFALLGEHFLPPVLTEALHELASGTEPLPWESVESTLKTSLGARYKELDIEREAIAAASLAQVHRATIVESGEQICLKIQYPDLSDVIDADFDIVVRMLMLARWVRAGRELDEWLESMREQLHLEIDYQREAQMTALMAELLMPCNEARNKRRVRYGVPQIFPRYCSGEVLAMEFIEGHVVTQPEVASLSQKRRDALGSAMLELFFYELYDWGLLQTDPNFGNYLINSGARSDELILLDFGSTIKCEKEFLVNFGSAIASGQEQDTAGLIEALCGLGCLDSDSSEEAKASFSAFCMQLLEPLRPPAGMPPEYLNSEGNYCWAKSRLMARVGRQAASSAATRHFTSPSREFAMIARKLTGVFTFIAVLNAEFNAYDLVQQHIERWREKEQGNNGR